MLCVRVLLEFRFVGFSLRDARVALCSPHGTTRRVLNSPHLRCFFACFMLFFRSVFLQPHAKENEHGTISKEATHAEGVKDTKQNEHREHYNQQPNTQRKREQ